MKSIYRQSMNNKEQFSIKFYNCILCTGYYGGAEDYYTKIHKVPCHEKNVHFTGYDFRDNENVDYAANKNYSTYQYRDRAINLINNHDKNEVLNI